MLHPHASLINSRAKVGSLSDPWSLVTSTTLVNCLHQLPDQQQHNQLTNQSSRSACCALIETSGTLQTILFIRHCQDEARQSKDKSAKAVILGDRSVAGCWAGWHTQAWTDCSTQLHDQPRDPSLTQAGVEAARCGAVPRAATEGVGQYGP